MRNPFDFLCESLSFWILLFFIDNIVFEKSEHSNLNKYLHNPISYWTKTWYMFGVWHPVNDSNNSGCWRIMVFLVLAISSMDVHKKKFYHCEGGESYKRDISHTKSRLEYHLMFYHHWLNHFSLCVGSLIFIDTLIVHILVDTFLWVDLLIHTRLNLVGVNLRKEEVRKGHIVPCLRGEVMFWIFWDWT